MSIFITVFWSKILLLFTKVRICLFRNKKLFIVVFLSVISVYLIVPLPWKKFRFSYQPTQPIQGVSSLVNLPVPWDSFSKIAIPESVKYYNVYFSNNDDGEYNMFPIVTLLDNTAFLKSARDDFARDADRVCSSICSDIIPEDYVELPEITDQGISYRLEKYKSVL